MKCGGLWRTGLLLLLTMVFVMLNADSEFGSNGVLAADATETYCESFVQNGYCDHPFFSRYDHECKDNCTLSSLAELMVYACILQPSHGREDCTNTKLQTCYPVSLGIGSCQEIIIEDSRKSSSRYIASAMDVIDPTPETKERMIYLSLQEYNGHITFTLHQDQQCSTPWSDLEFINGFTLIGECKTLQSKLEGGETLFHLSVFKNCTQTKDGDWNCHGDNTRCDHWTRSTSKSACELTSDLTSRPEFLCAWSEENESCVFEHSRPLCRILTEVECGSQPHCEFDTTLNSCAKADVCQCTSDGLSGPALVDVIGCSRRHAELAASNKHICYIKGGYAFANFCGCSFPSSKFIGAAYRTCAEAEGCNTLTIESTNELFSNQYTFIEGENQPFGCVPYISFTSRHLGISSSGSLHIYKSEDGFAPDNVALLYLSKFWAFTFVDSGLSYSDSTAEIQYSRLAMQQYTTYINTHDVSGPYIQADGEMQIIEGTCDSRFPCLRPIWSVSEESVNSSVSLEAKLAVLEKHSGALHSRITLGAAQRSYKEAVVMLLDCVVDNFIVKRVSKHPFYSSTAPNVSILCTGHSIFDERLTHPELAVKFRDEEVQGGLAEFNLTLKPFSIFFCYAYVSGDDCVPNNGIAKVFITAPAIASAPPSLTISGTTEECITVEAATSPIQLNGILRGYQMELQLDTRLLKSTFSISPTHQFCDLTPGTVYTIKANAVNEVGSGPIGTIDVSTRDGIPKVAPMLSVARVSPFSATITWNFLTREDVNGQAIGFKLLVFSATEFDILEWALTHSAFINGAFHPPLPDSVVSQEENDYDASTNSLLINTLLEDHVYGFVIFVFNRHNIGPASNPAILSLYQQSTGLHDASSNTSILYIMEFVLIPIIIGVLLFIIYYKVVHSSLQSPLPLSYDIVDMWTIEDPSSVEVTESFFESDTFAVSFGIMTQSIQQRSSEDEFFDSSLDEKNEQSTVTVHIPVMVKQLLDRSNSVGILMFCNELSILHEIQGSDLVPTVHGIYFDKYTAFSCLEGIRTSVTDCLRENRPQLYQTSMLDDLDLVNIAIEAAGALCFIHERSIIHRNLSAENFFIRDDGHVLLGNFSLAKKSDDVGLISDEALLDSLNVRWQSPESIADNIYTRESDMYVFGVTLWEIFSFAKRPWAGYNSNEIAVTVQRGTHLDKPANCSHLAYKVMLMCWKLTPNSRISSNELEIKLSALKTSLITAQEEMVVSTVHPTRKNSSNHLSAVNISQSSSSRLRNSIVPLAENSESMTADLKEDSSELVTVNTLPNIDEKLGFKLGFENENGPLLDEKNFNSNSSSSFV
eukprot:m.70137 g.70137  ORF g.70137 m.70137 type:complete len:1321 (+) comp8299_c0_seq1:169-4131(+)